MMDKSKDNNNIIRVLQINIGHRIVVHDALMSWLVTNKNKWVICMQEPYFTKKGVARLPISYGAFWKEDNTKMRRAMIIAPKEYKGYMVTQFSSADRIVVRFEKFNVCIIFMYYALDKDIHEVMKGFIQESECRKNVICCIDTNAHHERWGSEMKGRKWKGRTRGKELLQLIEESGLYIYVMSALIALPL